MINMGECLDQYKGGMSWLFLMLFIISQFLSVAAVFVTLPYPKLSMWEAYKMAVPFSWLAWIPLTYALSINTLGANQTIFLLIVVQFAVIVVANFFYLGKTVSVSEMAAFALLLLAYWISNDSLISRALTPAKPCTNPDKRECNNQKSNEPLVFPIDEETLLGA
jgi:hypothetical protein